jgi:hypothetical protein
MGNPWDWFVLKIDYELFAHDYNWPLGVRIECNYEFWYSCDGGMNWWRDGVGGVSSTDWDMDPNTFHYQTGSDTIGNRYENYDPGDMFLLTIEFVSYQWNGAAWVVTGVNTGYNAYYILV